MSTGLHAGQATGVTVTQRDQSFNRTESVTRWSREGRAAPEAEREALLFIFFLFYSLTGARCSRGRHLLHERGHGFFLFPIFWVSFCCCCAMLCFVVTRYISYSISKEENQYRTYLGYVCTYVRTYVRNVTLGIVKSPICNY